MDVLFLVDLNRDTDVKEVQDYFSANPITENCEGLRKVSMDGYNLYINCVVV